MIIRIKKLHPEARLPEYQKAGDAGFDLRSLKSIVIAPWQTALVGTGLAFVIPDGFEMQVRPRSGLSMKTPLIMPNSPGTVDSGYRGEVCVILRNLSDQPYMVGAGERVAQGVIAPVTRADFEEIEILPASERGCGGFGSTGLE